MKSLVPGVSVAYQDVGRICVGYAYLTGVVADGENIVINGRTYQFWTADPMTGDVKVDVTGDLTADAAVTALVAAINADSSRSVNALAGAANGDAASSCLFMARSAGTTNYTLSETMANGVVSAATMTNAASPGSYQLLIGSYTVTAQDVTVWAAARDVAVMGIPSQTATPVIVSMVVRATAGNYKSIATLKTTITQVNSAYYIVKMQDPSAVLAFTDVIQFVVKASVV